MAKTIYLPGGSRETLFCGEDADKKAGDLERILAEHLGHDAAALLREMIHDHKNETAALADELKCCECSCDSYRSCLQEVLDGLNGAAALLTEKRLDRKKLGALLSDLTTTIDQKL